MPDYVKGCTVKVGATLYTKEGLAWYDGTGTLEIDDEVVKASKLKVSFPKNYEDRLVAGHGSGVL